MDLDNFIEVESGNAYKAVNGSLVAVNSQIELVRNIPRFVASESYTEAFGLQWNTFKRTQLDSYTGTDISETRLRTALGCPLEHLKGLRVLEAGCGAGRFTQVLLKHGAKVYSFDYSTAVDANAENNMPSENLTLFQADIAAIPFKNDFFDVVICLGVLQHTPSTTASLRELKRVLKPGGSLACDHYKWHLGNFTSLYLPWWFLIRQLPSQQQLKLTDLLTRIFFPIHWKFRDSPTTQLLLRRISPINFYYGQFDLSKELLFEWSRLDTHDRNTDHYKRHVTRRDFENILRGLKFNEFDVFVGGTGFVAKAIK